MSKHRNRFMAIMELSAQDRAFVLDQHKPAFPSIYCRHVTLAYSVPGDFRLPKGPQTIKIYGRHVGVDAECLLVEVNGQVLRPNNKPYHITYSVEPGVEPSTAGFIRPETIEFAEHCLQLTLFAKLAPLQVIQQGKPIYYHEARRDRTAPWTGPWSRDQVTA